ncbi:acyltransferase [Enterobacter hormaechei]|uniref:acyltransferase family protein n=1 Tax=Enterobacter hormaechei TaxID=158836 RepID=UPI0022F028DA|nr:acyltransferase [Enterobacter hormaechei]MDA4741946.1 acyltransferase [Enterobacter hormaechei]
MLKSRKQIESIQALRGIAAILVMMFHFRTEINKSFPGIGDYLFINGTMGVDLFFVISGFIIFYITDSVHGGTSSAKKFIINRFCRIAPPYYLITLCVAGGSLASWSETIRSILFIPLDGESIGPYYGYARLYVGWTLNYEMFFYLLCALSILFYSKKWMVLTGTILALVLLPSIFFGWNNLDSNKGYQFTITYLKLITNPIILEFLAGCFIGWVYKKGININNKAFWLILFILAASFFAYIYFSGALRGNGVTKYMIPCALLLFSIIEYEKRYGIKIPSTLVYLGSISYSVYLIHIQALSLVSKLSKKLLKFDIIIPGVIVAVFSVVLTVLLAHLSHKYIELKFSTWLKHKMLHNVRAHSDLQRS